MTTILNFLKPYKSLCFFTLLVMFVDVAGSLLIPTIMAKMIDAGIEGKDVSYMIQSGKIMLIVAIISGLSALLGSYLAATLSSKLGRDMRKAIYGKSLEFSSYDFERFGTGSMITRTMNDVNIVQQSAVWLIQMVLPVPAVCVSGVVMAFIIDASMGFLLIGAIVAIMSLSVFITRKASLIFDMLQKFLDKMNVLLRENISGVRVIRAFNKEKYEEKRMRKSFEDYAESAIRANRLFAALESFALFAVNFLFVIILWLGGNRIGIGLMEIGDIVALAQYVAIISFYIMMAQMVMIMMPRAIICVRRILEPLSRTPEIKDGNMSLDTSMEPTEEVVSFQKVSFRFADADENVLENLNFKCKKGETTAIIGGTGSGKSTIAKLILRFHDATSGAILLKGKDIKNLTQRELREHVSYVPQKVWLFSGAIADNLTHGSEPADEYRIKRALSAAQAEFVYDLPDGIYSRVSQGGANFSGGQKQRLSIARALSKKADMYIFDDSFSALDFKTDAALRKALAEETKDAAVLIISQRINAIINADQIVVLEEGKIVGIGNHDFLTKNCRVYQDIAKSQMAGQPFEGG